MSLAPERILLIRPSALGDVCRTAPVLAALRQAYPHAAIDWLVQDSFAAAIAGHPALHEAVLFPRAALSRWRRPRTWAPIRSFLRSLRERRYDLVLDCQGLARSGLFAAATGAPRRVGLVNAAELGWLGLTEAVRAPRSMHTVDRMMLVASAAGAGPHIDLRLYAAHSDRRYVHHDLGLIPGAYTLLAPTTRWPAKRWPDERFAELAHRLLADAPLSGRIAFVGSGSEQQQCPELAGLAAADPRVVNLVGRTTVGQLMAVVEGARLVVACDSAALHMAVGFDRPLVALFGPTDAARVGPYGRGRDVIQHLYPGDVLNHKDAALGAAIMDRITVDEVLAAAAARLLSCSSAQAPPAQGPS